MAKRGSAHRRALRLSGNVSAYEVLCIARRVAPSIPANPSRTCSPSSRPGLSPTCQRSRRDAILAGSDHLQRLWIVGPEALHEIDERDEVGVARAGPRVSAAANPVSVPRGLKVRRRRWGIARCKVRNFASDPRMLDELALACDAGAAAWWKRSGGDKCTQMAAALSLASCIPR